MTCTVAVHAPSRQAAAAACRTAWRWPSMPCMQWPSACASGFVSAASSPRLCCVCVQTNPSCATLTPTAPAAAIDAMEVDPQLLQLMAAHANAPIAMPVFHVSPARGHALSYTGSAADFQPGLADVRREEDLGPGGGSHSRTRSRSPRRDRVQVSRGPWSPERRKQWQARQRRKEEQFRAMLLAAGSDGEAGPAPAAGGPAAGSTGQRSRSARRAFSPPGGHMTQELPGTQVRVRLGTAYYGTLGGSYTRCHSAH